MGQLVNLEEAEILRRVHRHREVEKKFQQLYKELPTFEDIHGDKNPPDVGLFEDEFDDLLWKIYGPKIKAAEETLEIFLSFLLMALSLYVLADLCK